MQQRTSIEKRYEKIKQTAKETLDNTELILIIVGSKEFENMDHVLCLLNALIHIEYFYIKQLIIEMSRKRLSNKYRVYIQSAVSKNIPLQLATDIFRALLSIKSLCS